VKAAEVKRLAESASPEAIADAIEAITEREADPSWVHGEDVSEKLTHLLLAQRILERVAAGASVKDAFRAELAGVRDVLTNETPGA
jgi:hypothetical protein